MRAYLQPAKVRQASTEPACFSRRALRFVMVGGLFFSTAFSVAPSANADGERYVALGDSYSSGVGSGSYLASSGACKQSVVRYPQLWAAAHPDVDFADATCSGATTATVEANQLSALDSSTTLVSLTAGGNDEDFSSTMQTCILWSTLPCISAVKAKIADTDAHLGAKLTALYADIRQRAPHAKVVVLGYPNFYDLRQSPIGLSQASRTQIDAGIDEVDTVMEKAANSAGFSFVDVRANFRDHIIGDKPSWLNSLMITDISSSYHPTVLGQSQGYLPAFAQAAQ